MSRGVVNGFCLFLLMGINVGLWAIRPVQAQHIKPAQTPDSVCRPGHAGADFRIRENLAGFQDSNLCSGGIPKYSKLCEAPGGKLYGLTCYGGLHNAGVLFAFDPSTGRVVKILNFDSLYSGSNPYGSLMLASDGRLYGLTRSGGRNGAGVLFEVLPSSGRFTKLADFHAQTSGTCPYGSLTEGADGMLYGLTSKGGCNGAGVLFVFNPRTQRLLPLVDLDPVQHGQFPHGSLMRAGNGLLYGMTREGGSYGYGTLFEFDPQGVVLSKRVDFDGQQKGCYPRGDLVCVGGDVLFGLTASGGTSKMGVLFSFNITTGVFNKIMDFTDKKAGICPLGSLMLTQQNELLGMTYQGGEYGFGVLFSYDPLRKKYTKKADFTGMNGKYPFGSLIQASDGKIYGMTQFGGVSGGGVLFVFDAERGEILKKVDFRGYSNGWGPKN